ncbi:MAG: SpoIIE family protein phosphatase [Bryobacteraceae bacterium]|nr:SpoIIE family protein phosphatase [Bryobacteraceae bacterium]
MMNPRRIRVLLAVLFVLTAAYQLALNLGQIRAAAERTERARLPFRVDGDGKVREAEPVSGVQKGDRLVSLGGARVAGPSDLIRAVAARKPGESVQAALERDGQRVEVAATLRPAAESELRFPDWLFLIEFAILTPWLCLLLGFFVAFVRPRDPLAWLLLALMLSFGQMAGAQAAGFALWSAPWRQIGEAWRTFLQTTWPVWMTLFGMYFPDRHARGVANWMLRWVLALPMLIFSLGITAVNVYSAETFGALAGLQQALEAANPVHFAAMFLAIGSFFANIGFKMGTSKGDDRRRLKLLYWGAMVALTPTGILVIAARIAGRPFTTFSEWIWLPPLLLLLLFPVTLAYVIVVGRALDVKFVIREGLQYALATRGARVLQVLVTGAVLLTVVAWASDPNMSRPNRIATVFRGVAVIFLLEAAVRWGQKWIDKRFFREEINAERMLGELSDRVRTIIEPRPLVETVVHGIAETLHVSRVAAFHELNGIFAPDYSVGYDSGVPAVSFEPSGALVGHLKNRRVPAKVYWDDPEAWVNRDLSGPEERKGLEELETQLLLPINGRDGLLGFLSLGPRRGDAPYARTEVQLLQSVAVQTGLALENARLAQEVVRETAQRERMHRELEIAWEVQQTLYPKSVVMPAGLDYAGYCRPAQSVGGDYYDFFEVEGAPGHYGIAIGDISGKGIPAALLMASLQASLRGLTLDGSPLLAAMMNKLNRLIYASSPANRYATFFYGQLDSRARRFTYVNGGHNEPMVFRAGGGIERLAAGGPPIGLFGPARYEQGFVELAPGDLIVMFTDGVSECMNNSDEEFGEDGIIQTVESARSAKANELIARIMAACDQFAAGAPQHDDMTLVVVRVLAN